MDALFTAADETGPHTKRISIWKKVKPRILKERDADKCKEGREINAIDEQLLYYFAGFVARKSIAIAKCEQCTSTLRKPGQSFDVPEKFAKFLQIRDHFGTLLVPTDDLFALICTLEEKISKINLTPSTFLEIVEKLEDGVPFVGCSSRCESVTSYVIKFFIILRINIKYRLKKEELETRKRTIALCKSSKLK